MKKIYVILVIGTLFFQCMAHYFVLALYEIRKEYVANYLCEQRNNPVNICCGKCYLQKQIIKTNSGPQSDKAGIQKIEKPEFVVYYTPATSLQLHPHIAPDAPKIPGIKNLRAELLSRSVFHPPC